MKNRSLLSRSGICSGVYVDVPTPVLLPGKIPWMEEPGRLQSVGSLRVRQDLATSLSLFTFMHWRRKWQPTPLFLPGESQGQGSLVGCRLWGPQSRTRLKRLSSSSSIHGCTAEFLSVWRTNSTFQRGMEHRTFPKLIWPQNLSFSPHKIPRQANSSYNTLWEMPF